MLMSINHLAEITGKARRTVKNRCVDLDQHKRGNRRAIYYESSEALPRIYGADVDDGKPSDAQQREQARLNHHKANIEELKEAKIRGELVPIEAVERVAADMIGAARAQLLALPTKVAPMAIAAASARECEERLRVEVNAALSELSEESLQRAGALVEDLESAADIDGESMG